MSRKILYAGAAAAILSAVALPALASTETIGLNQWYTAQFGSAFPSAVFGGDAFSVGTHPNAIATTVGSTDWSITLTSAEPLTVVDMEASGDQFQVLDNGVVLGNTSPPVAGDFVGACISCALADPNFSRGVFFLGAGVNDITINFLGGGEGAGDLSFLVGNAAVPEPAAWALMLAGFAGLGAALRGRRKVLASPA